jgi:2-dehydro-3-deoxy-D-arabinonate dehydratase
MRFARIIDGMTGRFCLVAGNGEMWTLGDGADVPGDYLGLHTAAKRRGQTPTAYATELAERGERLPWTLGDLDRAPGPQPYLGLPYVPPEAWGAAFTYDFRPGPQLQDDPFLQERRAQRPVLFFKATPSRCVGPNDAVGSRGDTTHMIPEPELGLILDEGGQIIGYTAVNDVSSRDLPRANPLYVCYSKTFTRCLSLGPTIAPPEAIADPTNLAVRCRVVRDGAVVWDETGNTGRMYRTLAELIHHLTAHNAIPLGTLLATGTALSPPQDMHIVGGDWLEIEVEGIGRLANPVVNV